MSATSVDPQVELDLLRRANAELRKRAERYRTFVTLSAGWHWEQDVEFRFTDFGIGESWPAAASPMGAMLGKRPWELPGMTVQGGWEKHRALLESHLPFRDVEFSETSADGSRVTVMRVSGVPILEDGKFRGYRGVGNDITDQLAAQAANREMQRELAALMSNLPGMAYRCQPHEPWPLEFASEGALQLTGYNAEQLIEGKPFYGDLIHPDDQAEVAGHVHTAIRGKRHFQMTYRIRTPDGEKWVWEQGAAVYGPDDRAKCLEGFITDITSYRLARDEIASLNASLEARVAQRTGELETAISELEAFSYSIAHDLRAPLLSIASFSHLLEDEEVARTPEKRLRYLRRIAAGVKYMNNLTDALLSLAKLSRDDMAAEDIDIAHMAREALAGLQEVEPHRVVIASIPDSLPARGDTRMIGRVVANLVGNAWKFSAKQASATLEIGVKPMPDGANAFFIADNGVGFSIKYAGRLFEPFQRLHTQAEFEGTGIGLALVRKIVSRHGGTIWAESEPGKGATFFFTLAG